MYMYVHVCTCMYMYVHMYCPRSWADNKYSIACDRIYNSYAHIVKRNNEKQSLQVINKVFPTKDTKCK